MKVKNLIKKLQKADPEKDVYFETVEALEPIDFGILDQESDVILYNWESDRCEQDCCNKEVL
jgi:hypothetical protein